MKKILYSAVGGTDPISNFHDGSLLHICRVYKPDVVFLLMSAEICQHQKKDNRYLYCLNKLSEHINHKFKIETLEYPDLTNVHDFDVIYPLMTDNLKKIKSHMSKEDKLYFNISSGTPAMKYCLQFIAAIGEYEITPIVVSTPEKKMNPHTENRNVYDTESYWELNEDNDSQNFENRCTESKSAPMFEEFNRIAIKRFVEDYNYSSALTLINKCNSNRIFDDIIELVEAAGSRLLLNIKNAERILSKYDFKLPFYDERQAVFEYALSLGIKIRHKEYADFVRAITPLATDLYVRALKVNCGIDLNKLTDNKRNKITWNKEKISKNAPEIIDIFEDEYKKQGGFKYDIVSNVHLHTILNKKITDNKLLDNLQKLSSIETKVRNSAAHTMISLDDTKLKSLTGFSAEQIYEIIKNIMKTINIPVTEWDSYDKMNYLILQKIDYKIDY